MLLMAGLAKKETVGICEQFRCAAGSIGFDNGNFKSLAGSIVS